MERKAAELAESQRKQLATFKVNLEEFARKYAKEIRGDPRFRMQFQRMCQVIGVDPLVSSKGFWGELLGVGDFYCELGIQIIEICMATRPMNGGVVELGELKRRIDRKRGNSRQQSVSEDDVKRAIKQLKPLGGGYRVITVGSRKMVQSVPRVMNTDQTEILVLAQNKGHFSVPDVTSTYNWNDDRISACINSMLRDGIVWVDYQVQPAQYWVSAYFFS
ncbi:ESCRT II complex subunit Dot2 [Spiromyces aspiralis]|uniref:ESCRT II complex subunit Dot2 n=1 Tax=Spiromyces aspiralis TaxID=68401 RepID=A0ACC1HTS7_9FUNG|nr:ESCRT II complex subunit Dot2 [Spiromyces aspiralis]